MGLRGISVVIKRQQVRGRREEGKRKGMRPGITCDSSYYYTTTSTKGGSWGFKSARLPSPHLL